MEAAVNAARDSGLLVTSSSIEQTHGVGIHGLGREPMADPDKFESYGPGLWWARQFMTQGVAGQHTHPDGFADDRRTAGQRRLRILPAGRVELDHPLPRRRVCAGLPGQAGDNA